MDETAQWQGTSHYSIPTWGSMQRWWCHGSRILTRPGHSIPHHPWQQPGPASQWGSTKHQNAPSCFSLCSALSASQAPYIKRNLIAGKCSRCVIAHHKNSLFRSQPGECFPAQQVFGKMPYPRCKICFNRNFPIKLKVLDKLWVHVKAKDYEFKLLSTQ